MPRMVPTVIISKCDVISFGNLMEASSSSIRKWQLASIMRKGILEFTKPNFANAPICLSSLFIPKLKLNEIFEIFSIKIMPVEDRH